MAYEDIEKHLAGLGIAPLNPGGHVPVRDEVWNQVGPEAGAHVPKVVRWLFTRFGGFRFPAGVFYFDPHYKKDMMAGWFLDEQDLLTTFEYTRDPLPADVMPISDDGGDNHLAVGVGLRNSGLVYYHVHDAPLDVNLHVVSDSIEQFLLSLHRDEEEPRPA